MSPDNPYRMSSPQLLVGVGVTFFFVIDQPNCSLFPLLVLGGLSIQGTLPSLRRGGSFLGGGGTTPDVWQGMRGVIGSFYKLSPLAGREKSSLDGTVTGDNISSLSTKRGGSSATFARSGWHGRVPLWRATVLRRLECSPLHPPPSVPPHPTPYAGLFFRAEIIFKILRF